MIKSIASFSKDNSTPCLMMSNGLYLLPNNNWLMVLNDKIAKAEFSIQDLNIWHDTCISLVGKDVRMVQYLKMKDLNYLVVGLENEIMVIDLDTGIDLFHRQMSLENATCALITNVCQQILIGTTLGRIFRINAIGNKDLDWELCKDLKMSENIWAICEFKDYLVLSLGSGALEFWKETDGSWNCIKKIESKYDQYFFDF